MICCRKFSRSNLGKFKFDASGGDGGDGGHGGLRAENPGSEGGGIP